VLQPRRAASAWDVGRAEALGDDSLEAQLFDPRDEIVGPLDHHARRRAPGGAVERELLEQCPAIRIGEGPRRLAVKVKKIEDLQHRRPSITGRAGEAVAKPGEVRPPVASKAHQLAVERHPTLAELVGDVRELREVRRALAAVARA
jgi:hypothetical protein